MVVALFHHTIKKCRRFLNFGLNNWCGKHDDNFDVKTQVEDFHWLLDEVDKHCSCDITIKKNNIISIIGKLDVDKEGGWAIYSNGSWSVSGF